MVPSVIEAVVPPVYDNIGVIIGTEAPVRFATVKIVAVIRTIIRGVIGGAISGYIRTSIGASRETYGDDRHQDRTYNKH